MPVAVVEAENLDATSREGLEPGFIISPSYDRAWVQENLLTELTAGSAARRRSCAGPDDTIDERHARAGRGPARAAGRASTGIAKAYGPTRANRDVSLAIAPGEVVGLVGANGAGKSTLMRVLTGGTLPDAGSFHVDGAEVAWAGYGPRAAHAPRHPHRPPGALALPQPDGGRELLPRAARAAARPCPSGSRPTGRMVRDSLAEVFPGGADRPRRPRRPPRHRRAADARDRPRRARPAAAAPDPRRAHLVAASERGRALHAHVAARAPRGARRHLHQPQAPGGARGLRPDRRHAQRRRGLGPPAGGDDAREPHGGRGRSPPRSPRPPRRAAGSRGRCLSGSTAR